MKYWKNGRLFALLLLILASVANAQFTDDFSDGDFTNNPTWTGDDSLFVVQDEVLRSNRTGAMSYQLSTPSSLVDDTRWEFWVNLNFSVTGANYVDVYLMADNPDLHAVENGYFLRLGGTPKQIALFALDDGVESIIIDGPSGQIGSSSNNIFIIRTDRTAEGDWIVLADDDALGQFETVGFTTHNAVTAATHFGIRIVQSSAAGPINNHFFDDFSVAPIPVDLTPPELLLAHAPGPTEIRLVFDEAVDEITASEPTNYSITDVGTPAAAMHNPDSPAEVTLTLGAPLASGQNYTVTATNVEDMSGNATPGTSAEFFYYVPGIPEYKKVVFNEIMADPNPPVMDLPNEEYLELYNSSEEFFDLEGWILVNTTTPKTLTPHLLPPGGYLLLCDANHVELFQDFGPTMGIPSFVALANAGDSLTLLSPEGLTVDVVSYTTDWYGDSQLSGGGYSLELINPHTPCGGASNWSASQDPQGGTPGAVNSIFDDTPDLTPPVVEETVVNTDNDRITLIFNETLDETSLLSAEFAIAPSLEISEVIPGPDNVLTLVLASPLEIGVDYQLTIMGIADCEGNFLTEPLEISIFIGATPGLHDVLISEIMADPNPSAGLPEGEYFELYNASGQTVELMGCNLSGIAFQKSTLIEPGGYAVFASVQNTTVFFTIPEMQFLENFSTTFLTNGGRELRLVNPHGETIDRVEYNLTWYGDPAKEDGGYSLERINMNEPCRGKDNWRASIAQKGGSPGYENSVWDDTPDLDPPSLTALFVRSETEIELLFSEVLDSLGVLTASVEITPELPVLALDNVSPDYTSVSVILGAAPEVGVIYEITISGMADCMGNVMNGEQTMRFALPQPVEPGDLLINEVLFNPRTDASDFVEVVNVSSKAVSLEGMKLLNASLTERVITGDPVLMLPGDYLVFTPTPDNLIAEYPLGRRENFFYIESLPSYPNASGSVILTDADGEILDQFDYLENYHLPLLVTYKGVSLERLSFTRPTNDPGNWASASEQVGYATPGYLNSQYLPEETPTNVTFELQKDLFSPDNDGFEDVLYINYRMDEPGFVATIRIYDRYGRPVRTLANNTVLGTTGTITWDGITDQRTKARIGPYIILVETFHPEGQTNTFKLPCIVAGRLSQ